MKTPLYSTNGPESGFILLIPMRVASALASCAIAVVQGDAETVNVEIKLASKNRFIAKILGESCCAVLLQWTANRLRLTNHSHSG